MIIRSDSGCLADEAKAHCGMGKILDYIQKQGAGNYHCYSTKKYSLDDNTHDNLSYDEKSVSVDKKGSFAETDKFRAHTIEIDSSIRHSSTPIFSFFLDGSRHTYKVDDIGISNKIFPVVAGQIVVGCCERKSRDEFRRYAVNSRIVLSMPTDFDIDDANVNNNFCRLQCEKINENLQKSEFVKKHNISLDSIFLYETDGHKDSENSKSKYLSKAIEKIQNEMTDEEQRLVERLCKENKLDDDHFLIKDGSLEYNPRYSNLSRAQWDILRSNYKYVVGVSKSFDPELIPDFEGHKLSRTIANLKLYQRTKVYRYKSEHTGSYFAVWYLRLRNSDFRENHFSDVIKCEMVLSDENDEKDTLLIDLISANLIREAYPVCYGNDSRWANHLYPVYLTETFCKSHYISNEIIFKLF